MLWMATEYRQALAARVKNDRKGRGLSQIDFAKRARPAPGVFWRPGFIFS